MALPVAARSPMALGVTVTDGIGDAAAVQDAVQAHVASVGGHKPAFWTVWSSWGSRGGKSSCKAGAGTCYFPGDTLRMLRDMGIQGHVWWEPMNPNNPLAAKYARHKSTYLFKRNDAYIRQWAQKAKAFGEESGSQKIVLRLAAEANGSWFPWAVGVFDNTARTYKKFWRHVWRIFKQEGALPYVDFHWTVTVKACKGGCNPFKPVYPGDKFVDYVGASVFNWGTYRGKKWRSMEKILTVPMKQLWHVAKKPVIIPELASHWKPYNKAKWISRGYKFAHDRWSRLKGISYFNTNAPTKDFGHPDWRLKRPFDGSALTAYENISALAKFQGTLP